MAGGCTLEKKQVEEIAWIRLRVKNANNKDTAEDVEVMVVSVQARKRRRGQDQPVGDSRNPDSDNPDRPPSEHHAVLDGMALHWSFTPDTTRANIPPGGFRIVDVAKIPRKYAANGAGVLAIRVAREPVDDSHYLDWEVTEIELAVTARNMRARRYRVAIKYDGTWGDKREDIWKQKHLELLEVMAIEERRRWWT